MMQTSDVRIQNGFKIRGIEPPDLKDYDASTRKLFWSWVLEFALRRKDKELSQGLDKDGHPLRPISEETRRNRRSAMTPSGKGDPEAPPLIPGWQKSRTRSLLTGRAFSTHVDMFWAYDAWTGASWGVVLSYQAAKGRDVFGLSKAGTAWVKVQAWAKWDRWKAGLVRTVPTAKPRQTAAMPKFSQAHIEHIEAGVSSSGKAPSATTMGKSWGYSTPEERRKYFSQTADAVIPGRAKNPKSMSPISGPKYNILLGHVHGVQSFPGRGGAGPKATPAKPKPPPKKPAPASPKPVPPPPPPPPPKPVPGKFTHVDQVLDWAKETFPNAKVDLNQIGLDAWNVITDELSRMVVKFPGIRDRMLTFGSMDVTEYGENTIAQAVTGSGRLLQFNPPFWRDLKKLGETFVNGVKSEFHPKGVEHAGVKYYVTHEVGHLVDGLLEGTDNKKWNALVKNFRGSDGRFDPTEARYVSQYAATEEVEAFAETFASAHWRQDGGNQIVNDFKKRLGL
jgi:hypothetical protein